MVAVVNAFSIESDTEPQDVKLNSMITAAKKIVCSFFITRTATVQVFYASLTEQRINLDIDCVVTVLVREAHVISHKRSRHGAFYVFVVDDYVGFQLSALL